MRRRRARDVTDDEVAIYVLACAATIVEGPDLESVWLAQFPGLDDDEAHAMRDRVEREMRRLVRTLRARADAISNPGPPRVPWSSLSCAQREMLSKAAVMLPLAGPSSRFAVGAASSTRRALVRRGLIDRAGAITPDGLATHADRSLAR